MTQQSGRKSMEISLNVNGQPRRVDVDEDTPLLWVLRDSLGLTGTKFGCGIAACGACTVHINGTAARSCSIPAAAVQDQPITTIEGHRLTAATSRTTGGVDCSSGAAMRLLPVGNDHGGGGPARAETRSPPMKRSMRRSPISVAAAPTNVCVGQSTAVASRRMRSPCRATTVEAASIERTAKAAVEQPIMGKWTRRAFIATGGLVGGGLVLGLAGIAFAPNRLGVVPKGEGDAAAADDVDQNRAGQHGHGDRASLRDGAGRAHRAGDDARRKNSKPTGT